MDGDAFSFITPRSFRTNIIESVEFTAWLWVTAQKIEEKYTDEILRTIILYNSAIIEALLLFRAKKQKIKLYKTEYKQPSKLQTAFQNKSGNIVLAFQEKTERGEAHIWLSDLLREQKSFLGNKLHDEITSLQGVRNTLHLSRERETLSMKYAEESYDAVYKVVSKLKREMKK